MSLLSINVGRAPIEGLTPPVGHARSPLFHMNALRLIA